MAKLPPCEAIPFLRDDDVIFEFDFPEDVVKYKEKLTPLKSNLSYKQLFLEDLNVSYKNTNIDKLAIHKSSIRPSQACAVFIIRDWHRGIIIRQNTINLITVKLIDENVVKIIKRENIKYLMTMFK